MRSHKGTRKIIYENSEYRWTARGDDGFIRICISPSSGLGPSILGSVSYHENWSRFESENLGTGYSSNGDQVIITNRMIRLILDHCFFNEGYDPHIKGSNINLKNLDGIIDWSKAIRAKS